jgi:2-polyprenyl-3-methyl-5-hydroxy-6-metoxy-1,4-benzoquinol methylase
MRSALKGTQLSESQKAQIKRLLEDDVPVSKIKDLLLLPDADMIYEVVYGTAVNNRYRKSSDKYARAIAGRKLYTAYDKVANAIRNFRAENGPLKILEHGCGSGYFAYRLAREFTDCQVEGMDLSEAGIELARSKYALPNLSFFQADGYKLSERKISYDVVCHVNVLEHVPDPVAYVQTGVNLLGVDRGALFFSFPAENYWRFWGFPKFLLCRLLRRPFEIHAFSTDAIDHALSRIENFKVRTKESEGLHLPRRLYYYLPERYLARFGGWLEAIETQLVQAGIAFPLMFTFYEGYKVDPTVVTCETKQPVENHKRDLTFAFVPLGILWIVSNILMFWEVLSGRKTVFRQD